MSPDVTRRLTLQALAATISVGLAGCLSEERTVPNDRSDTSTVRETTPLSSTVSTDKTRSTQATTSVDSWWENPEPEKDHDVTIENHHDQLHTVELTIAHDEKPVFEGSYELSPGSTVTPYNFLQSPLDGIVDYDVEAHLEDGQADGTTFSTDSCHGDVVVTVDETGELAVFYSIC
jgi:hypothetical protein